MKDKSENNSISDKSSSSPKHLEIYNLAQNSDPVNTVLQKTKRLISETKAFKAYINNYKEITIEPTFKLPEVNSYPIVKNKEFIPLSTIDFYKGFKKNYNEEFFHKIEANSPIKIRTPKSDSPNIIVHRVDNHTDIARANVLARAEISNRMDCSFSKKRRNKSSVFDEKLSVSGMKLRPIKASHCKSESMSFIKNNNDDSNFFVHKNNLHKMVNVEDHDLIKALNLNTETFIESIKSGLNLCRSTTNILRDDQTSHMMKKHNLGEYNFEHKKKSTLVLTNLSNHGNTVYSKFVKKRFVNQTHKNKDVYNQFKGNIKETYEKTQAEHYFNNIIRYVDSRLAFMMNNDINNQTSYKECSLNHEMTMKLESVNLNIKTYQFICDLDESRREKFCDEFSKSIPLPACYQDTIHFLKSKVIQLPFDLIPIIYCLCQKELKYFVSQILAINNSRPESNTAKEEDPDIFGLNHKKQQKISEVGKRRVSSRIYNPQAFSHLKDIKEGQEDFKSDDLIINLEKVKIFLRNNNLQSKILKPSSKAKNSQAFNLDLNADPKASPCYKDISVFKDHEANPDFTPIIIPKNNKLEIPLITKSNLHIIEIEFPVLKLIINSQKKVLQKSLELETCLDILKDNMSNWEEKCKIHLINTKTFRDTFRNIFSYKASMSHSQRASWIEFAPTQLKQDCNKLEILNERVCSSNFISERSIQSQLKLDVAHEENQSTKHFEVISLNKLQLDRNEEFNEEFNFIVHKCQNFMFYTLSSYTIKYTSNEVESLFFLSIKHLRSLEKLRPYNLSNILYKFISVDSEHKLPKINTFQLDNIDEVIKQLTLDKESKKKKFELDYIIDYYPPKLKCKFIAKSSEVYETKEESSLIVNESILNELKQTDVSLWGFAMYTVYDCIDSDNKAIVGSRIKYNFGMKMNKDKKARLDQEQKLKEEE